MSVTLPECSNGPEGPDLQARSRVARTVLGRALRGLAGWVPDAAADRLRAAADEQEGAVLAHITDGDFMATHWLVSFALLARDGLGRR